MDDLTNNQIIGKGIIFPLTLDQLGRVKITEGLDLIKASIINILVFNYGERYFLRQFGSKLFVLLDEPNDDVLMALIRTYIIEVITKWEKRVELTSVEVQRTSYDKISLHLNYVVISTQQEDTFIFPFYTNIAV